MPNPAAGEVRWTEDGPVARITLKGKVRKPFPLTACRTKEEATERCAFVSRLAARFRQAGLIETPRALELLRMAAGEPKAMLAGVLEVAGEFVGGKLVDKAAPSAPTFAKLAEQWTSGELHKLYPDNVKKKDSDVDEARFKKITAIEVGGARFGDIPVDRVTLDHAQDVMRKLPEEAKSAGTRRHYAQLLSRVLALAVYPCRYITSSPLPRGFMPKNGKPPSFPYLYPDEDATLLKCTKPTVPLCYRVLWGFLAREGAREGEAIGLHVRDFDLKRGTVSLDENKTDDPRTWMLDASVTRALAAWVKLREAKPDDPMFVDEHGGILTPDHRLAALLRAHLVAAGVTRPELHNNGTNRRRLRVHDLRGTFVTLGLANGKTETWVADRTGHKSSQMINRYRRSARSASELGLGPLQPLDALISELSEGVETELASVSSPPHRPETSGSTGDRTPDQWIKNPLLYRLSYRPGRALGTARGRAT